MFSPSNGVPGSFISLASLQRLVMKQLSNVIFMEVVVGVWCSFCSFGSVSKAPQIFQLNANIPMNFISLACISSEIIFELVQFSNLSVCLYIIFLVSI